jgi:4-hydroxy-2-oxoheptanedioate aldolase
MRRRNTVMVMGAALAAAAVSLQGQSGKHINPMIDLLAAGKPVFGLAAPTAGRGGGGGRRGGGDAAAAAPATPAPPAVVRTPADLAKDTLAHPEADYFFNGNMERAVEPGITAFTAYADALVEAGAIVKSPTHRLLAPLSVKTPKISTDPARAIDNVSKQLNAGVTSISFVHVDTAQELEQGIAAMRFKSRGGTRPDDIGNAAKYWGLTEAQYREKADVWPLNPNGELVAWAIIETKEGVANVREIAQVKGLGVLIPGAGTLGGVYSTMVDGKRVRDDKAWEDANQQILAACKEFKVACGYPAGPNDIEMRMKQGFSVFIIQAFNESGFRAVQIGRQVSGRDK